MSNLSRPLSEDLTTEKIAQIRAKLISNRRTKIVRPDEEESRTQSMVMGDLEVNMNIRKNALTDKCFVILANKH